MELYDTFEKYLLDKMEGKEKNLFEIRLKEDKDFKSDFDFHRNGQDVMDFLLEEDMKSHLKKLKSSSAPEKTFTIEKNNIDNKTTIKPRRFPRWLGLAASFLLLASFWFLMNNSNNNQELFDQYYEIPIDNVTRGVDNVSPEKSEFSRAHGYLFSGEIPKAIASFQEIQNQKDHPFAKSSEWFLSLCYLKQNDKQKAIQLLNKIVSSEHHPLTARAKSLLAEL